MEKLYQVRLYNCDDEEIVWENLSRSCIFIGWCVETEGWEFKTLQQAEKVFENYKNDIKKGEVIVITETPALSEDECEELGIEYYIKGIKIFSK